MAPVSLCGEDARSAPPWRARSAQARTSQMDAPGSSGTQTSTFKPAPADRAVPPRRFLRVRYRVLAPFQQDAPAPLPLLGEPPLGQGARLQALTPPFRIRCGHRYTMTAASTALLKGKARLSLSGFPQVLCHSSLAVSCSQFQVCAHVGTSLVFSCPIDWCPPDTDAHTHLYSSHSLSPPHARVALHPFLCFILWAARPQISKGSPKSSLVLFKKKICMILSQWFSNCGGLAIHHPLQCAMDWYHIWS